MATQLERRTATRQSLLDAAIACLVRSGVSGFTTTEVGKGAAVSQGALFKHFPSKADLWAATIGELFANLRAEWVDRFTELADDERTPERGIELLWHEMHDPRLAAAYELYTAARTDAELQAALEPVVRDHVALIAALSVATLPTPPADPDGFAATVDLVVLAMQGLVLQQMAVPDPAQAERLLATVHALGATLAASPSLLMEASA